MKSPIDTKPFVEYCKVLSLKIIYCLLESEARLKIKSRAEEILFDTSKQNTKKLKCFELK